MSIPVVQYPHKRLIWLAFLISVILVGVWWYLILICISLMTSDVKHLFVIADHLDGFSCEMSIQIFCPYLKIGLFDLMLSCKSSLLYILDTSLFFKKKDFII